MFARRVWTSFVVLIVWALVGGGSPDPAFAQAAQSPRPAVGLRQYTTDARLSPRTSEYLLPAEPRTYSATHWPGRTVHWQPQVSLRDTHWQPQVSLRETHWQPQPSRWSAAQTSRQVGQPSAARVIQLPGMRSRASTARRPQDLYHPRTSRQPLGYTRRSGTTDYWVPSTGGYLYGVRNRRGGQDLFDSRSGRWFYGVQNRGGSLDYFDPATGSWIWSTRR